MTAFEREEKRRQEKRDKKDQEIQQMDDYRNTLPVRFTKMPKHQVCAGWETWLQLCRTLSAFRSSLIRHCLSYVMRITLSFHVLATLLMVINYFVATHFFYIFTVSISVVEGEG